MNLTLSKLKLSAPWILYYKEINALFGEDPEIKVVYDEENLEIKLYVENSEKADALTQLLPAEKVFGAVVLKTTIIPANKTKTANVSVFQNAFEGNPALSYVTKIDNVFSNPVSYVVFKNKVVQFFNDDLGDINGNKSTLYQEIAKDVFSEHQGIFFCTDTPDNLGKPVVRKTIAPPVVAASKESK